MKLSQTRLNFHVSINSFYIDEMPIREVRRTEAMGGDYPSKPMSLYATIWDASNWATSGGKYKVNYKYSPFTSEFHDLSLVGCRVDPIQMLPTSTENCTAANSDLMNTGLTVITPDKRKAMRAFREKFMTYSVCYDTLRYPEKLPECEIVEAEKRRFKESGHLKFSHHRRHRSSRARRSTATDPSMHSSMWELRACVRWFCCLTDAAYFMSFVWVGR